MPKKPQEYVIRQLLRINLRNKSILRARILKAKRIISDVRDRKRLAEFLKYGKIYH